MVNTFTWQDLLLLAGFYTVYIPLNTEYIVTMRYKSYSVKFLTLAPPFPYFCGHIINFFLNKIPGELEFNPCFNKALNPERLLAVVCNLCIQHSRDFVKSHMITLLWTWSVECWKPRSELNVLPKSQWDNCMHEKIFVLCSKQTASVRSAIPSLVYTLFTLSLTSLFACLKFFPPMVRYEIPYRYHTVKTAAAQPKVFSNTNIE